MIRVLLSVTSPALRAGLHALLAADEQIRIVGNSLEEESEADVIITTSASHASFPDNERGTLPRAAILLLSDDPLEVREMKRTHKVWGALHPDASAEELNAAVRALSQGLIVGAPTLLWEENEPPSHSPLTERESEVLELLARGMANKQIAAALGISEHTVKFHVSSIYSKLNVTNRAEAVREGLRGGWLAL
ncbi:MAG TPA: response regulator transcription factor [Anaerolineales bacterium]|nr:response regulator transcription factor [Anaerolineales bacterium]